ncbi:5609_t:CDS:2, partial [Ambispora leptoticha]
MVDLLLDVQSLVSLLQGTAPLNEQKDPNVRFAESVNLQKYISKSYRGDILPLNKNTQRMLRLEEIKGQLPSKSRVEDVDALIQRLNNNTVNEQENYPTGMVIQLVTRLLVYSLQFRRCMSSVPTDRLNSAVVAISDYKNAQLDLSNPFTTLDWGVLTNEFLERAQNVLRLSVNPYSNPTDDLKAILIGASPFLVSGGAIQPLDAEVTYVENLYRQAAGQF